MTSTPASPVPELSIIIGVQHAQDNLVAILAAIGADTNPDIEVLLCHAQNDPVDPALASAPGVRIVSGKNDALIPELWRDGILSARAYRVAIISAHCIPDKDWAGVARGLDMERCVAYGGMIRNSATSDATGTAIHLLRYSRFSEIPAPRPTSDIAADNSVYDRAAILACSDLLPLGFWEPSYHDRFKARGLKLEITPCLRVTHTNQYTVREFIGQRHLHGRAFGRARAGAAPIWRRWLMLAFAPAAYPIHAAKLTINILKTPALRNGFWRAAPRFYLFLASWTWGEAKGYADAALGRARQLQRLPTDMAE